VSIIVVIVSCDLPVSDMKLFGYEKLGELAEQLLAIMARQPQEKKVGFATACFRFHLV